MVRVVVPGRRRASGVVLRLVPSRRPPVMVSLRRNPSGSVRKVRRPEASVMVSGWPRRL